jgi:purine catabolism regulator
MTPDQIVEFAEGLARVAASGGGPTALAAHLAEATGAGVLVEDADWHHIAAAGIGSMPATARGHSGGNVATVPISTGATQLGWLSLFGNGERAKVTALVRLAASSIAVELARDAGSLRSRRRGFWERLIGRGYHDAGAAREEALARGITLAHSYLCIALEPDDTALMGDLRACAAEAFRIETDLSMLERGAAIVAFVPALREVDVTNTRTAASLLPKSALKRHPALHFSGGMAPVCLVLDAGRALEQAQAALTIGRRLYGAGKIANYEDLGAYPLLYSGAGVAELRALAATVLESLRAYDEQHQTELERTLRLYFNSGENVKTTAAELSVHRHTVFYRLRQIADISGRSLESAHDQLTLRLAIAIDALNT